MTPKEIDALPTLMRERPITADDIAKGVFGRVVVYIDPRPVKVTPFRSGEPICYADSQGDLWTVHEWADGEKFKEPFYVF